jgi:predicted  nucleic acid-binding Zn-ribbon protein
MACAIFNKMPHQCVRCSTFYDDGAPELLKGCECGGRLFFYIKKEKLEASRKIAEQVSNLSAEDKEQIEQDVFELVGAEPTQDEPVILDLESIRVVGPGKYELDLVNLFKGEPLIFKLDEGKYMIDVAQTFNKLRKKATAKKGNQKKRR